MKVQPLSIDSDVRVVQGGSVARFTNRKNNESRITDIKISFSRITEVVGSKD